METSKKLPLEITKADRDNPYVASRLAQEAFSLANYDMSPDNMVEEAIRRELLVVKPTSDPLPPARIRRMPGNGSFA